MDMIPTMNCLVLYLMKSEAFGLGPSLKTAVHGETYVTRCSKFKTDKI